MIMETVPIFGAKKRFAELVEMAVGGEPQIITENGVEKAVIISYQEYCRLTNPQGSLAEFLLNSPLRGSDLDLTRDKSLK